jgi:hypothetical protein
MKNRYFVYLLYNDLWPNTALYKSLNDLLKVYNPL